MVALKLQIFYLIFIVLSLVTNPSQGCTPLKNSTGNSKSLVDELKAILKPLYNLTLQYNNSSSVPNAELLLDQFRSGEDNEDVHLNFTQLVTKYGYPVEQHEVETNDGYILTMFRVCRNESGPPMLLMHGLQSSSDDMIIAGPNVSIAYLLADAGFDVWIGNNRGNKYSRHHVTLSPDCSEFWDFSFDELGRYDLPAMIDKVLNITHSDQLLYVGHSQGTTSFFAMCSEKPEYNNKISLMIALSADAYYIDVRSPPFRAASLFPKTFALLAKTIGLYELARDSIIDTALDLFCGTPEMAAVYCETLIFLFVGIDYQQMNVPILPVIFGHIPAGSSTKALIHYLQLSHSGKFQNYDYSAIENLKKYGTSDPPEYHLERVTCPVSVFYSLGDWLTSSISTEKLLSVLPNAVEFYHVPLRQFNHVDYIWAKNLKELVNNEIIRLSRKYTKL